MEVRKGYKLTEVGIIPKDWKICKQKDVVKYINGRSYSIHEWETDGFPVVRLQNLTNKGGNFYYSNLKLPEHQYMNLGDLIFMWSASFGPYIWWGEKAIFHYHIWKIECDTALIDKIFYYNKLIEITDNLKKKMSGSTMMHLTKGSMENHFIAIPSNKSEQTAIAKVLSDTDSLISNLEKLIAKKQLIKQGTMQGLLTGKKRVDKFKNNWRTRDLKELVKQFIVPMRDKPKKFLGSIPWCRIEDFDGKYLYDSKSYQYVDQSVVKEMNLKIYPIDTLLVSCSADLGRCAIVKKPLITNQTFIGLVVNESIASNEFLYYYMTYNSDVLNKLSSGTTISYLSREQFENLKIYVPESKDEQIEIATILSDMDSEISTLESKLTKYLQIKQGMMQNLLTGKIRLV